MAFSIHFSGGVPGWLGVVIIFAALALTVLFYFQSRRSAPRSHLAFLTGLRVFAVLLVAVLALKPLLTTRVEKERSGERLILIDKSESMAVNDYPNLPNRFESVLAALDVSSTAMKTLGKRFRLEAHSFDSGPRGETPLADIASLAPDGKSTDIVAALDAAAMRLEGKRAAGIILFSDGVETDTDAGGYSGGVPVTTVGVGSRLSAEGNFKDVILSAVEVLPSGEPVVAKDNLAQIAAYVEGLGFGGLVTPVRLLDSAGTVLAQENLALDTARGDQRVVLSFTPSRKGNFKFTVDIPRQSEEIISENNTRNLNITVADPQIRVLYVEGTLRWEYRYLKRILERDPNVRLLTLVRLSERTFYQQGNVTDIELTGFPSDLETLKRFNVIIIGDLPASALSRGDMANIDETVRAGAGLLMLGGYNSFSEGGYAGTPVAGALPVVVAETPAGQDRNEFVPQLTDLGELSPIFSGITEYFSGPARVAAREAPALLGQTIIGSPKPGASVLVSNPLRSDAAGDLPVLVVQDFGAGRTAAFAVDTTWQWYTAMKGMGLESPYVRFWGQFVRWLARQEAEEETGEPGVTVWIDKAFYGLGDDVRVTAEVRGADGLLTDKAAATAVLTGPEEITVPMGQEAGTKGRYRATLAPSLAGDYSVSVAATENGSELGSGLAAFEVGIENVELRRIDLDEDYLRSIASESGGQYIPLVEFPAYVAALRGENEAESTVVILNLRRKQVLYPLFIIFVALVTVEWIWRKRIEMP